MNSDLTHAERYIEHRLDVSADGENLILPFHAVRCIATHLRSNSSDADVRTVADDVMAVVGFSQFGMMTVTSEHARKILRASKATKVRPVVKIVLPEVDPDGDLWNPSHLDVLGKRQKP